MPPGARRHSALKVMGAIRDEVSVGMGPGAVQRLIPELNEKEGPGGVGWYW